MRICLLGEYSGDFDEGMRNVSSHFAEELTKEHQVLTSDLRNVFTKEFWKSIKKFSPDIIHYVHGPSIKSFLLLKMLSLYCRDAKTVMSAMHPGFSFLSKRSIPLFKPNLILIQSSNTEEIFKMLEIKTKFLPSGVDVERFKPVMTKTKEELREKYGIDKDKFVILHVGSVKEGRNIQLLEKLQTGDNQGVIVGAVSTGTEKNLIPQLKKSGCLVWTKYIENVEELYELSDCYIFPTPPQNRSNAIEMPLSVLEAMSCNLPVITTRFGALPRVFKEGDGLFFAEGEEEFINALKEIENGVNVKTREKVLPYSWENVGKKLEETYYNLIGDDTNGN